MLGCRNQEYDAVLKTVARNGLGVQISFPAPLHSVLKELVLYMDVYKKEPIKGFEDYQIDTNGIVCKECYNKRENTVLENKILENKEQIYKMACEGKTVKQIAESLGLIPQSFSRACRRLNIIYKLV